jgi:hypothetical protein
MRQSEFIWALFILSLFARPLHASELEKIVAIQQAQIQKIIEDNKILRQDLDQQKKVVRGMNVLQFFNSWGYSQYPTESASPFVRLPFSINAAGSGAAYVLMCSLNASTGNSTRASMHLVRAGYDGNNYSMEIIAGKDSPVIYSHRARSDGFIEVQTYGGNTNCLILGNKG